MISILKAFRDALVADITLTVLVPAANIYAGLRDEKTPIPAVDIFQIAGGAPDRYAGSAIGGMSKANDAIQISVFHLNEASGWKISDRIMSLLLGDNTTLNAAGIKNISLIAAPASAREANLSHIPIRFRYNYHYTIT
ncbi:MAG: hypothetical protein DRI69_09650 [Bacteroidetes bacterium]|nr:MAG: hypothetical protein DRI69_09650 [Bacteroidota bacterium]